MVSPSNLPPRAFTVLVSSDNFELTLVEEPKVEPVTAVISESGGN